MLNLEHSKTREKISRIDKKSLEKNFPASKVAQKRDEKNQQKILLRSQSTKTLLENPLRILQQQNCAQQRAQRSRGNAAPPPAK